MQAAGTATLSDVKQSSPLRKMAPVLPQAAAKNSATQQWKSLNTKFLAHLRTATTMFDDGRFAQRVVDKASASGSAKPVALQRVSKSGVTRPPVDTPLSEGFDGGGGVRLHPPHLDEPLDVAA